MAVTVVVMVAETRPGRFHTRDVGGSDSGDRIIDARVTGGFRRGHPVETRSGSTAKNVSLLAAAAAFQQAAQADPSPSNLHAWGVAQLLLGDDDSAVQDLDDAAGREPANARYQSDLAAALLTQSVHRRTAADLPRALQVAELAAKLDPLLLEAWFNRALILDRLALRDAARAAWNDYLARDARSEWATEARERLGRSAVRRRAARNL